MYDGYMRHRSKSTRYYAPSERWKYYPVSCSNRTWGSEFSFTGYPWIGETKWIDDNVTPGFHKLKRMKKHLPVNPLRIKESKSRVYGTSNVLIQTVAATCSSPADYSKENDYDMWFTSWFAPNARPENVPLIVDETKENLRKEVWTKTLADRLKGQTNLVESLAEIDKTIGMIRHPFENVNRFILDFRRNGKRAKGYSRVAADSNAFIQFVSSEWLRFRYGISPLVSDTRAVMKTLKKRYQPTPVVSVSKSTQAIEQSSIVYGSLEGTSLRQRYQIVKLHRYDARTHIADEITGGPWNDLGLTFHNVIGVAWELTHYSFVVDWFVNVGDLIYANIPRVGAKTVSSYLTHRDEVRTVISPTVTENKLPSQYVVSASVGETIELIDSVLIRTTPSPDAALVIKTDFRLSNWIRATDAATLLKQRLGSIGFIGH